MNIFSAFMRLRHKELRESEVNLGDIFQVSFEKREGGGIEEDKEKKEGWEGSSVTFK